MEVTLTDYQRIVRCLSETDWGKKIIEGEVRLYPATAFLKDMRRIKGSLRLHYISLVGLKRFAELMTSPLSNNDGPYNRLDRAVARTCSNLIRIGTLSVQ